MSASDLAGEAEREREVYLHSNRDSADIGQIPKENGCGCRSKFANLGPRLTEFITKVVQKGPNNGQQLGSNM